MDKRKNTSTRKTVSAKEKMIVITLVQEIDVIECYSLGHCNLKIGREVGLPKSTEGKM